MGNNANVMVKMGLEMIILLIVAFLFNYLYITTIPVAYDCGTGYTANLTSNQCMLNSDTTITKTIQDPIIAGITWLPSLITAIGMIYLIDILS